MGAAVVGRRDGSEALLSGGVPLNQGVSDTLAGLFSTPSPGGGGDTNVGKRLAISQSGASQFSLPARSFEFSAMPISTKPNTVNGR